MRRIKRSFRLDTHQHEPSFCRVIGTIFVETSVDDSYESVQAFTSNSSCKARRSSSNRQRPAADAETFYDHNGAGELGRGNRCQYLRQLGYRFLLVVVTPSKEDNARLIGSRYCQKSRIVQIASENDSFLASGSIDYLNIRCRAHADVNRMNGLMTHLLEPLGQTWGEAACRSEPSSSEYDRLAFRKPCGVTECFVDVLWFQIWVGFENRIARLPRGHQPQKPGDWKAKIADAGFSCAYLGVDRDAFKRHGRAP